MEKGKIIILNGTPRSGKSSIVKVIQDTFEGTWLNLGVDVYVDHITPKNYQPGIGLRPGGERPDLEPFVAACYAALYESIAAHSTLGLNVVADVGHHDSFTNPLNILADCAKRLLHFDVLFVGVKCPIETILERRNQPNDDGRTYLTATAETPIPAPVLLWQQAVHTPGIYDLEVDTSVKSPRECAKLIRASLAQIGGTKTAFKKLAGKLLK